jgi:putative phosphoribosyl transferase
VVQAPTLLIVGERDPSVIELNRAAMAVLAAPSRLEVVPGATHLFEEPGTLEHVARLAEDWFVQYLHPIAYRDATSERSNTHG